MATVLVVDDVATNREVVCTLLGYRGHRVLEAGGADEALTVAHREHPDVIVTDMLMPGMDGYELAHALRTDPETADAALVFYSANYTEGELAPIMRACGVDHVVSKAGDPQQLLDAVEAALTGLGPPTPAGPVVDFDHVHTVNAKLVEKIRQLDSSDLRFRIMAESSPVGIFLVEPDGEASYVNERLEQIMGQPRAELLGQGWLQCLGDGPHDDALAAVAGALDQNLARRYRIPLRHRGGRVQWLNTHLRVVLDDTGHSSGAVGMVDDVTMVVEAEARSHAADRRQDLEAQRRVTQRLDSLRRLAGGVAHDYNNLLAVIHSFAGFVQDTMREELAAGRIDEAVATGAIADLDRVTEAADRATGLSRQLRLFGSRAVFEPTASDVGELVRAEGEVLASILDDQVTVEVDLAPDLPLALTDGDQVRHVLQALIANAREAMPDGGTLRIETGLHCVAADPAGSELEPGEYVRLTVSDTGRGMTEDVLAHAIEPFFTTRPPGQGRGLGLATSYGIASQAGGDLEIESAPGAGTTVTVLLPVARWPDPALPTPADPTAPQRPRQPDSLAGPSTILVADDEAAVLALVERILSRAGYRVLTGCDGRAALAVAEQEPGPISCLVTDIVMPGMLGSELADHLTRRQPGLAVVFMSGYADPMLDETGASALAVPVLAKPFRTADLLAAVRAAIGAEQLT